MVRHGQKASRFNIMERLPGGMVGIYNTLTRALIYQQRDVWEHVSERDVESGRPENELTDQGFLLEENADENLALAKWRSLRRRTRWVREYRVRVGPRHVVGGRADAEEKISLPAARRIMKRMFQSLEASPPKRVRLDFIGADPSGHPEAVLFLAEGLSGFCRSGRITFSCGLNVTGDEYSGSFIRTMIFYGLDRIRLVCPEPISDLDINEVSRMKSLIIKSLPDSVDPEMLVVYDDLEKSAVRALKLAAGIRPGRLAGKVPIRFGQAIPMRSGGGRLEAVPCLPNCLADSDLGRLFYLEETAAGSGLAPPSGPIVIECPARNRDGACHGPDGSVQPCPSGVTPQVFDKDRSAVDLPDECRTKCPFGPLCDGGCLLRARQYGEAGALIHCRKKELNRRIRELIFKNAPK